MPAVVAVSAAVITMAAMIAVPTAVIAVVIMASVAAMPISALVTLMTHMAFMARTMTAARARLSARLRFLICFSSFFFCENVFLSSLYSDCVFLQAFRILNYIAYF